MTRKELKNWSLSLGTDCYQTAGLCFENNKNDLDDVMLLTTEALRSWLDRNHFSLAWFSLCSFLFWSFKVINIFPCACIGISSVSRIHCCLITKSFACFRKQFTILCVGSYAARCETRVLGSEVAAGSNRWLGESRGQQGLNFLGGAVCEFKKWKIKY